VGPQGRFIIIKKKMLNVFKSFFVLLKDFENYVRKKNYLIKYVYSIKNVCCYPLFINERGFGFFLCLSLESNIRDFHCQPAHQGFLAKKGEGGGSFVTPWDVYRNFEGEGGSTPVWGKTLFTYS